MFDIEDNIEIEKKQFVNRVNDLIFYQIDTIEPETYNYQTLFRCICLDLGEDSNKFKDRQVGESMDERNTHAPIKTLTEDDFLKTLKVLCILYKIITPKNDGQQWLSRNIELICSRCTCDIGIRWKDGFFYPSGAEELDKPLIDETLSWMNDYPNESKDFKNAIQIFSVGESLSDIIKNCYSAVEGIARGILGNKKTLDNNKDGLLAKINLSDGWKSILVNYIQYAHSYRHASEVRHDITKQEAEAYLYMTGLIIRLIIESIE